MLFLRRRATLLLSAGILGLLALAAADPDGLRRHRRLEDQARRVAEENRGLVRENHLLRREIRALQGDPAALERAAREELGFVRPGEVVFQLGEGSRR
jgi:cell division protein FtsB